MRYLRSATHRPIAPALAVLMLLGGTVVAVSVESPPTGSAPGDWRGARAFADQSASSAAAPQPEASTYDGAELFKTWCASCHGLAADGTGPMAPQMKRRVPDLTQIAEKNGGMFPVARVRRIIDGREVGAHGNPEMPVWGNAFKMTKDGFSEASVRARIDAIVRYLETIQRRNAQ